MTRLGILGGGQLAQMLTQAAVSLGLETAIFERLPDTPAARLTKYDFVGPWDDYSILRTFADVCDVITLENEFVDSSVLHTLESWGKTVYPSSKTLATIQDKLLQKQAMQAVQIPLPPFCSVSSVDDVMEAGRQFGFPLVLKARRDGYDGYGNVTVRTLDDIQPAMEKLSKNGNKLFVEAFVPFVRELAVMVLRGRDGEIRYYPTVETVQKDHVCHIVRAPASLSTKEDSNVRQMVSRAVEAVEGVGIFGVELFQLANGDILYNEIAPRPHNSGHYTIEGCVTSQFENHIRAVLGLPLGSTDLNALAVVMVNLLGEHMGDTSPTAINDALQIPEAHIHLYGKQTVRKGRKMGHITVLGSSFAEAEAKAIQAANLVRF